MSKNNGTGVIEEILADEKLRNTVFAAKTIEEVNEFAPLESDVLQNVVPFDKLIAHNEENGKDEQIMVVAVFRRPSDNAVVAISAIYNNLFTNYCIISSTKESGETYPYTYRKLEETNEKVEG